MGASIGEPAVQSVALVVVFVLGGTDQFVDELGGDHLPCPTAGLRAAQSPQLIIHTRQQRDCLTASAGSRRVSLKQRKRSDPVERGSDKHGPKQDDALEKELEGLLRGNHPTRAEEALDAEPPADDDPAVLRPESPGPGDEPD
jgi:hypothetical protein